MLIATKIKAMFKFKRKSKINPEVGTYFYYGVKNSNNIFKVVSVHKGFTHFAWWNENHEKCLVTSGTEITTFTNAVVEKKYIILLEEDYYMIPGGLKNFTWRG